MSASDRTIQANFRLFYFLAFWALGGLYPLLSIYLKEEIRLSGSQIGTLVSIGPIVMVIAQPVWGLICDWTGRARTVLVTALLATGGIGLGFLFFDEYLPLLAAASSLALFQGAIIPISDTLTVNYAMRHRLDYGSFRLWGAIGFAAAGFAMGWLAERFGLSVIFYGFALTLWLGAASARRMPGDRISMRMDLRSGLSRLIRLPRFALFLLATFLVFGPIFANNTYMGLLFQSSGATVAGVGLGFLLAAGSEVPFMKIAGNWIRRRGALAVTLFAAGISALRWLFYFFEPDILWLYLTSVVQGLSTGLFIPAALIYVRNLAPEEAKTTAVSLYTAAGTGLGNWFCTLLGGWILETFDIFTTYLFFGILTAVGAMILWIVLRLEKTGTKKASPEPAGRP
ncbi:MFS transporter, PPP family, 3-phenylpropionic acid transporter [Planifilum fulgidum]|uniref:MFS transporter, PPP family, 3-phenylpropionic acid transporter n=1 Tax=Planifilum fulgidum TaxID=201973 RepID=A0A1I2LZ15_9BACL|nr:MFS transporter [Planifilum fulgidum]SFF83810.1 MFS transporter, PPP family, 3-phenylpropionic acid transporter [Planifilum fulgidum]